MLGERGVWSRMVTGGRAKARRPRRLHPASLHNMGGVSGRADEGGSGLPQSKDGGPQWLTRRRRKRRAAEASGSGSETVTGPAVLAAPVLVQISDQTARSEEPWTV